MKSSQKTLSYSSNSKAGERLLVAAHLQAVEGNPLDAKDLAMFAMFEHEGWPADKRRDYIRECALVDRIASEEK